MDQKRAIAALGALALETRLDLFRLLVPCGPEGLPAGVIAERLGVLPSSPLFPPRATRSRGPHHATSFESADHLLR
jgi:hypothetical protein